jgi:hypothetical protein
MILRILSNDLGEDIVRIKEDNFSKVYQINASPKRIIKFTLGSTLIKEKFREKLFHSIEDDRNVTPKIIECGVTNIGEEVFTYSIQSFLEGVPIAGYPSEDVINIVMQGIYDFSELMKKASVMFNDEGIPSLSEIFIYYREKAPECRLKVELEKLMNDEKFVAILSEDEQYLFHGDLWKDNILINQSQISIIDVEPCFFGPEGAQLSTLLSAYFLLSKILFEDNENIDLEHLLSIWPKQVDKERILYLMFYFPLFIGLGKEQGFVDFPVNKDTYHNIMLPLYRMIDWIYKKLDEIK